MTKQMRKDIELAGFRFNADANGETHFTVEEARWLRDTLDTLLSPTVCIDDESSPVSFSRSVEYVYQRAITLGEFYANAERLLTEYGAHKEQTTLQ